MEMIGLILAVLVLAVGSYKGIGALAVSLMASAVVIITNRMDVWQGFMQNYMGGYTGAYMNFFLLFAAASLYASFMDKSGSATAIGYKMIDWFGKKRVMLVSTLTVAVLTYGGVSLFVVIFAVVPILYVLFKESGLPRHFIVAATTAGSATFTMTTLPGTPALTNIIPSNFLPTTMWAAPVLSLIASALTFTLVMLYMTIEERRIRARGETFSFPEGVDPSNYNVPDRSTLPNAFVAFAPIVVLLGIILVGSQLISRGSLTLTANQLAIFAMLIGTIIVWALNFKRIKDSGVKGIINRGVEGGIAGIGGFAAVLAFGAVVSASPAFQETLLPWVLGLDVNMYVRAIIATVAVSATTGSSSGGVNIMFQNLGDIFIGSGVNYEILHRLVSVAASSLDTLPHSPGLFVTFAVLGLTHKEAYKHVFFTSVVATSVTTLFILAVALLGIF